MKSNRSKRTLRYELCSHMQHQITYADNSQMVNLLMINKNQTLLKKTYGDLITTIQKAVYKHLYKSFSLSYLAQFVKRI